MGRVGYTSPSANRPLHLAQILCTADRCVVTFCSPNFQLSVLTHIYCSSERRESVLVCVNVQDVWEITYVLSSICHGDFPWSFASSFSLSEWGSILNVKMKGWCSYHGDFPWSLCYGSYLSDICIANRKWCHNWKSVPKWRWIIHHRVAWPS